MDNNQNLTDSITNNLDQVTAAIAQCLKDYLNVHWRTAQHYQILRFLADETLQRLSEGKQPVFNYLAIRGTITGETEGDASAWFGRHWKTLNGDFRQKCEEGIQKFALDQGLTVYPWIEKRESNGGAGNQALISLVAYPIPGASAQASRKLGLHTPSRNLVGPIETTYAGGHAVLDHVLWKTLRLDRLITSHADLWLGELPPDIQGIVYQSDAKLRFEKKICRSLNQTHLSMLERRVGPDALACLIVLLRLAAENGDAHFAQSLSRSICRMLLILGPILGVMGIRTALVQYFEQEILPLSSQSGRHYQFWSKGYLLAAYELNLLANLIEE